MFKIFLTAFFSLAFWTSFSYAKNDPVYQFPARPEDTPKLIEVSNLMGFIQNTYAAQVSQKGLTFHWNFDWNQSYIGAGSSIYQGQFSILYFGGFSRVPESHFGVVALTLCHEFGHLLAGEPRQRLENKVHGDWSSAEGQSDWFAATDCLPKVYQFFKKQIAEKSLMKDLASEKFCSLVQDKTQCEFIIQAGLGFSQINFRYFNTNPVSPEKNEPRVDMVANEKPAITLHSSYPSMQCRLDTYKQGALCAGDSKKCVRPRCWFNPEALF